MDQLVQSFQIQTPICLDQFLQIGKKEKEKNCYKCYRDGRYFIYVVSDNFWGSYHSLCHQFQTKESFCFPSYRPSSDDSPAA